MAVRGSTARKLYLTEDAEAVLRQYSHEAGTPMSTAVSNLILEHLVPKLGRTEAN